MVEGPSRASHYRGPDHARRPRGAKLIAGCWQKLAALDALKKSLLHQAFSGELAGKVLSAV